MTNAQQSSYGLAILAGLSASSKHVYSGTVDPVTKAERRAANKRSRVSRRKNRAR